MYKEVNRLRSYLWGVYKDEKYIDIKYFTEKLTEKLNTKKEILNTHYVSVMPILCFQ